MRNFTRSAIKQITPAVIPLIHKNGNSMNPDCLGRILDSSKGIDNGDGDGKRPPAKIALFF